MKILLLESDYKTINFNNEFGESTFLFGSNAVNNALKLLGYESIDEIENEFEKKIFYKTTKQFPNELILLSWRSKKEGNGFGKMVINKIFDLAKQFKVNKFRISMPSQKAKIILQHYVDKGCLLPTGDKRGLSDAQYYTEFFLIKRP